MLPTDVNQELKLSLKCKQNIVGGVCESVDCENAKIKTKKSQRGGGGGGGGRMGGCEPRIEVIVKMQKKREKKVVGVRSGGW